MIQNNYFLVEQRKVTRTSLLIKQRKNRGNLIESVNAIKFAVGDILTVIYWKSALLYRFEGICISMKSISSPNASLTLRNIIMGVGIEIAVSYFYNRVYRLTVADYKRKQFIYRRAKLYFLRKKINVASRVH